MSHGGDPSRVSASSTGGRIALAAFAVAVVYYVGVKVGMALTFAPMPVAVLWPPNALLLAALVLAPSRWWWALIAGAFPAHVIAELQVGVPPTMVLCWFGTNVTEALLGAWIIRRFAAARGLDTVRSVLVLCCAAVLAPFASSFLDAACVRLIGWGSPDYAAVWQARFVSNMLAILTFVPVAMTWSTKRRSRPQGGDARLAEVGGLLAGLLAASTVVFDSTFSDGAATSLLYLPVPFLIWAALRFGPSVSSASYAIVAFVVIWGAAHGRGPFLEAALQQDAAPIQLFLITLAVPLLLLAAVIEERQEAERKLRASRELFSTAFRSGPDAMAISRENDGAIVEANEQWAGLMGYDANQSDHPSMAPLAHHLDENGRQRMAALMKEGRGAGLLEVALLDCRGHSRIALVSVADVTVGDEPCHICIARDITQLRQAEKEVKEQRHQLTHLNRVASLADFSSTIAHELNQPLTAILSNAQAALRILSRDPPNVEELRTILAEIADADKRAALLIQHLRLLMKRGAGEFVQVDLNHQVKEVLDFARGQFLLRNVHVDANYSAELPLVRGDRVQLQQLVLNLVCNACEAMEGSSDGSKAVRVTTMHGYGQTVQVIVSDTGPGIPPEQLEGVFEPFFTTKENGLGMGLAICRKIAAVHGGVLSVQSQQGQGATFRLVLPSLQYVEQPPGDRDPLLRSAWRHPFFRLDSGQKAGANAQPSDSPQEERAGGPR
jgi:two-component system, LuxR family, sensor kinase FixL